MIELILLIILVILILIYIRLRSFALPSYLIRHNKKIVRGKRVVINVSIEGKGNFEEEFSITSNGFVKRFSLDGVIAEKSSFELHHEDSDFYTCDLNVGIHERTGQSIFDQYKGYLFAIEFSEKSGHARAVLMCTKESYEFLKHQISRNDMMAIMVDDGRLVKLNGGNVLLSDGPINFGLSGKFASTNSIKRFLIEYKKYPEKFKNSDLRYLAEKYKDKVQTIL